MVLGCCHPTSFHGEEQVHSLLKALRETTNIISLNHNYSYSKNDDNTINKNVQPKGNRKSFWILLSYLLETKAIYSLRKLNYLIMKSTSLKIIPSLEQHYTWSWLWVKANSSNWHWRIANKKEGERRGKSPWFHLHYMDKEHVLKHVLHRFLE